MAQPAKTGFRNSYFFRRYLTDAATYPLFVIIGGAAALVLFAGGRTLLGHPDVYISTAARGSTIRNNREQGEAHRDNFIRRATKERAEDPTGLAIIPALNNAILGQHTAQDKKKWHYDDEE